MLATSIEKLYELSDAQLVGKLLENDEAAINFVFYEKYASLFRVNAAKTAIKKGLCHEDLVQDFYLYLSKNDWEKLKKYNPNYPFASWLTVISYRFFKDCGRSLIDSANNMPMDDLDDKNPFIASQTKIDLIMMDIKKAIAKLKPPRDRQIVEALLIDEEEPSEVAERFGVTVDNLYNIKRRGVAKLAKLHLKEYQNK